MREYPAILAHKRFLLGPLVGRQNGSFLRICLFRNVRTNAIYRRVTHQTQDRRELRMPALMVNSHRGAYAKRQLVMDLCRSMTLKTPEYGWTWILEAYYANSSISDVQRLEVLRSACARVRRRSSVSPGLAFMESNVQTSTSICRLAARGHACEEDG